MIILRLRWIVFFVLFNLAITFIVSCSNDSRETDPDLFVSLTYGDCKDFNETSAETPKDKDCLDIYYRDNTLHVDHINAGFNCCPGKIVADVTVENNIISITESENDEGCDCLCLFDVSYSIIGLKPGDYSIKMIELYTTDEDPPLNCNFSLVEEAPERCCVDRHHYPWD